jgi:hypothetical protein
MVVHVSGCVSLLLYILLYEADVEAAEQLGKTLARSLLFTGLGLIVPKPVAARAVSTPARVAYGRPSVRVRWRPPLSVARVPGRS